MAKGPQAGLGLGGLTPEQEQALAEITPGGGTHERLSTVMSVDLVLTGGEQQIPFDPAQTLRSTGFAVNAGGSFTTNFDGFCAGSLSLHVDKSGGAGANLSIWIETKPLSTGVWQIVGTGMSNPIMHDDGGQAVALSGSVDALAGDEFRVIIQENSGTTTLTTETQVKALGTVNDYAASMTVYRVGPITP